MSNKPRIAVLILNYNGYSDTRECIKSINKLKYSNFYIIVVDNGSIGNDANRLRINFPNITLVESLINLGFTGGNNLGLHKAYELGFDYILFLNNDTIVSENLLEELVLFMENNKQVGLVGPITCYYNHKNTVSFAGGTLNRNTGLISFYKKDIDISNLVQLPIFCSFIEGTAIFVGYSLIKKIGGFNDIYFLTSEESELCIKVTNMGYKIAVLPTCKVWHKISKSMSIASELACYFVFRNKLYFVKNNHLNLKPKDIYQIIRYYLICLFSFFLKKRNSGACIGLIAGVIDFFKGTKGSGRFKKKLNA